MSFWIHPSAATELSEAALYYAEHASKEIANAFIAEFEQVKNLLMWNQTLGKEFEKGLRVFYFRHFPFGVIYCENTAGPEIYAVFHQRREPNYWQDRI
jgi:plasmid stabilization system protein ParE